MQSTVPDREEHRLDGLDRVRSLKETAELLGLSIATLRRRIAAGAIKVVHLSPRRVGITDHARAVFLEQNAT
jgi:predicted site-specific integrase-resolvase